jgi:threonyl-tRNA synthetase
VWLSPIQAAIIPVSKNFLNYAQEIYHILKQENIRIKLDDRNEKVGYKIRDWEVNHKPNYLLVVGEKEESEKKVSVRKIKKGDLGQMRIEEFIEKIQREIKEKITN